MKTSTGILLVIAIICGFLITLLNTNNFGKAASGLVFAFVAGIVLAIKMAMNK